MESKEQWVIERTRFQALCASIGETLRDLRAHTGFDWEAMYDSTFKVWDIHTPGGWITLPHTEAYAYIEREREFHCDI